MKTAEIHTPKGVMHVEFYAEDAPKTVKNFLDLAEKGYYDGLKFHRVIPNFVIQGGCPNTREGAKGQPGTGGPGYKIDCETTGNHQYHERGALSMAHAGKNTGGSQFFVVHSRDNTAHLDRVHTVFGKVTEGLDVIDAIRPNDEITKIVVKEASPYLLPHPPKKPWNDFQGFFVLTQPTFRPLNGCQGAMWSGTGRGLYFALQLRVPIRSVFAHQRLLQKLVHPHAQRSTKRAGWVADAPTVVVECLKALVFGNADGVQVAANGLFEARGPGQIRLLDAAFQDAALVVEGVGALLVVNGGSAEVVFPVFDVEALGIDSGPASLGEEGLDVGVLLLQNSQLGYFKRGTEVALDAAGTLAGFEVADEKLVGEVVGDDGFLDDNHGGG